MRPNILLIVSDDHAVKAVSAYGAGLNQTPHLDRLAREGVRLDHCYATNSICTPARATLLTGTYGHVNRVTTLDTLLDNRFPHVAKHLGVAGYQTAVIGKWHLGEGPTHEPKGFGAWSVLPGQGDYRDPTFIDREGTTVVPGYATDIITDKCLDWLAKRDRERPFFLMCHHKAPHRPFEPKAEHLSQWDGIDVIVPETFDDDYRTRATAAKSAKMKVVADLTYEDLGLVQPEGGRAVGEVLVAGSTVRKVPDFTDVDGVVLRDRNTGEAFRFASAQDLRQFKYQRYIKRYLATIASIDENVGRMLDWLDEDGSAADTIVIYTSDQGFFLGDHGWFDKRFIYEESFQVPCLIRYPRGLRPSVVDAIATNADFAPTFLDYAGLPIPTYMQGFSLRPVLEGARPPNWQTVAYHRYFMNRDDIHNAFAHYGVRTADHKLIYWYDAPLGELGAHEGEGVAEWELFDLKADPLELVNVVADLRYAAVLQDMTRRLEEKMAEIGDTPLHLAPG